MRSACRRVGLEGVIFHTLRHTCASWLVMEGVPLFEVSKLLRHASIQMTERYAHLAPDHLHSAVASIKFSAHDKFRVGRGQRNWSKSSGKWWARLDLNQRPLPCEGSANNYCPQQLPNTAVLKIPRPSSVPLSYPAVCHICANSTSYPTPSN